MRLEGEMASRREEETKRFFEREEVGLELLAQLTFPSTLFPEADAKY